MLASGSKDNSIKLWDPRQSREICSLYPHKNTVTVRPQAGNAVLAAPRLAGPGSLGRPPVARDCPTHPARSRTTEPLRAP